MNKLESIMKLAELGFTKDEIIAILHEPDPETGNQQETGNQNVTEDSIDAITNRILQKLALNIDHRANTPPEGNTNPVNDFYDNILKGVK